MFVLFYFNCCRQPDSESGKAETTGLNKKDSELSKEISEAQKAVMSKAKKSVLFDSDSDDDLFSTPSRLPSKQCTAPSTPQQLQLPQLKGKSKRILYNAPQKLHFLLMLFHIKDNFLS